MAIYQNKASYVFLYYDQDTFQSWNPVDDTYSYHGKWVFSEQKNDKKSFEISSSTM